ncbi:FadR/GntR family transcriptional regulator [Alkalihalobacillus sp. AL-G]|uniref:FadR/GntR family transcriptional regulator n=1 Tax=Alkalihalobacillus sp. AL-G TaxID=2926399 RepID=UPI00272BF752|nr:FadR/GntR family transcriptional regulator [Alkalihalobacillus sp. AL-G]WLD93324.1 FadR family transcriptional regulator [Alkalihalobacillus sp. AL-G]
MNLSPIKKKRLYQHIVKQIQMAIKGGGILPGEKLPSERVLASTLSVSRTSVKEAFSVLEAAGVVQIKQGSGVYLLKNSKEDILEKINTILQGRSVNMVELMELRQSIEGDAAYYAAVRSDKKTIELLGKAYERLEQAVRNKTLAADEDYQFHICIAKAARNSLIFRVMDMVSGELFAGLEESRTKTLEVPGKSKEILHEHLQIYEAIKEGDPQAARDAMRDHLQKVKQRYL